MGEQPHLSTRFDTEFGALSMRVMELGGLVEAQARGAIQALVAFDDVAACAVSDGERRVNQLELDLDRDLWSVIGRRQPRACDLRLLTALSKTTTSLERVGDEAERIARMVRSTASRGARQCMGGVRDLAPAADLAVDQLRRALNALVRLDTTDAVAVLRQDSRLDAQFAVFLSRMAARMAEEPAGVSNGVDLLFAAKAIERIGHHARSIAECIFYVVQGTDVRHATVADIERSAL